MEYRLGSQLATTDGRADAFAHIQGRQPKRIPNQESVPAADLRQVLAQVITVAGWLIDVVVDQAGLFQLLDQ